MTRRRWIADEASGKHAALVGAHAEHLVRVLRVRAGQEFDIVTGDSVHRGTVVSVAEGRVEFELGEKVAAAAAVQITLLLSIFKFDRMEWVIEKCTELGVARIVPVIARRTDEHLASAAVKRVERWRRIALQAAEQSRRERPPEIDSPIKLTDAMNISGGFRIVLAESEQRTRLRDVFSSCTEDEVLLAIGPEGGWADSERTLFDEAGWIAVSLGHTILRAETAAIAAIVITVSELT
jgi:16S rRNA (uracil1498-N3)-methyltransferase